MFTTEAALRRLLSGAGLSVQQTPNGAFMIVKPETVGATGEVQSISYDGASLPQTGDSEAAEQSSAYA